LYFLRHCERSEAIQAQAMTRIASGCALAGDDGEEERHDDESNAHNHAA
jgi:hypothetical protein